MNIIITGATSFIGKNLVERLIKENHHLFLLLRKDSKKNEYFYNIPNINTYDDIKQFPNIHYDILFHFAWCGKGSIDRQNEEIQKQSFQLSKNIYDYFDVEQFIFAGSQAEIGRKSIYGIYKEKFYEYAKLQNKNKFIHLRIFSVYGEGDHETSLINTCVESYLNNKQIELASCMQKWNYLYIDDLISILINIINKNIPSGTYDIGSHTTKVLREFIEEINVKAIYNKREDNTEGNKDLIPNIKNIIDKIGDFEEIDFKTGIEKIINEKLSRNKCIICNNNLNKEIFNLPQAPNRAQQLKKEYSENDTSNLHLYYCNNCNTFQLSNKEVPYYKEVIRSGGISSTMKNLRIKEYELLCKYIDKTKEEYTICEIGSGKNEFLKIWEETNFYKEKTVNLIGYNYDKKLDFKYDIFTQFNFLEHQVNPKKMLFEIYEHLNDGGIGIITVPSFEYIINHTSYYELIIDHLLYFTFESLNNLLIEVGFKVEHTDIVNEDTLEFVVSKNSKNKLYKNTSLEELKLRKIKNLNYDEIKYKLYQSYINVNKNVNDFINKLQQENKTLGAWGASHQGFTILNTTSLKKITKFVIDNASFKNGCFVPGTNIKIENKNYLFKNKTNCIIILAPGYVIEIINEIKKDFNCDIEIYYIKYDNILKWEE
ncbi:MAG: NAD-dependent epimerase/dehydratase family protein [Eubacteriales bacterium]|nr:NAD-dependent epimerase/dehydratase family protein [Eubacteriales bacterium]